MLGNTIETNKFYTLKKKKKWFCKVWPNGGEKEKMMESLNSRIFLQSGVMDQEIQYTDLKVGLMVALEGRLCHIDCYFMSF